MSRRYQNFRQSGRGHRSFNSGPPDCVEEIGFLSQPCENQIVLKSTHSKIPYFNAPIYLDNKVQIGKIDEIFGPINEVYFSVTLVENTKASSYSNGQKFFIDPGKLLPLSRFVGDQPKSRPSFGSRVGGGRGFSSRGFSRGRGSFRGGRGGRGGRSGGSFRGRGFRGSR
ncbi:H/ACA ribonucleoprotein complex subunit 1-like protein 2 [Intoshia linei]|uniref:H/ACA ribonucleoprotein complex subunit n=1 Tax=Intoshia linei TaxID=1819745 RepID=A0A177B6U0_9BILA|nr:H/ACA ribonucleoprotein complex subunit 1-like protein 2 [Intoshia linei]